MVLITSLWLPILLSAVFVFIISSIIHTVLTYHFTDFGKVPQEDEVRESLGKFNIPPGDYIVPCPDTPKGRNTPEFKEKIEKGPIAFLTVLPNGQPNMASSLMQWFVYSIIIGITAAYITGRVLGPGAEYLEVFRFAGTTAFAGYSLALMQNSIWFSKSWIATLKSMFDGLIYSLLTAGTFGWLWP